MLALTEAHDVLLLDVSQAGQVDVFELAQNGRLAVVHAAHQALGALANHGQSDVELADAVGVACLLGYAFCDLVTDNVCFHGLFSCDASDDPAMYPARVAFSSRRGTPGREMWSRISSAVMCARMTVMSFP